MSGEGECQTCGCSVWLLLLLIDRAMARTSIYGGTAVYLMMMHAV